MKTRGNVIFKKEWEFWLVVIVQIISIVAIIPAIQNIMAFYKEMIR